MEKVKITLQNGTIHEWTVKEDTGDLMRLWNWVLRNKSGVLWFVEGGINAAEIITIEYIPEETEETEEILT